ncbi:MAG: hypothetical protein JJV92_07980 [Desulfosarcina sp.]|nr:hypothetical protein [Desulfobacterales bacterium]
MSQFLTAGRHSRIARIEIFFWRRDRADNGGYLWDYVAATPGAVDSMLPGLLHPVLIREVEQQNIQ